MRRVMIGAGAGALILLAGCVPGRAPNVVAPQQARIPANPKPEQLVAYLNLNAQRIQSIESRDVEIDAKQGGQAITLVGCNIICRKPRDFRMTAKVVGTPGVDMGSNQNEFWWWVSKSPEPYLFHCSYDALAQGGAVFPIQPDSIIEAMGLKEFDPKGQYEVRDDGRTIRLIQRTVSPQRQQVTKVTYINRNASGGQPQVYGQQLLDDKGKEICSAWIHEVQAVDAPGAAGAVVPRVVQLRWPVQQLDLKMKFKEVIVNGNIPDDRARALFTRPNLRGVRSFDVAARRFDDQLGELRPAGGPIPGGQPIR
ncbi:MAG TPA: hypothetical protein VFA26_14205 [Gemmataceae bacterium]|nr:hypothetical protein [Gemmataceae bacterium]